VTSRVRRAGAFAGVSTLAVAAPALRASAATAGLAGTTDAVVPMAVAAPFLAVALGAFFVEDGPAFDLFARPGDHEERRLYGLIGFTLAAAGLGLLAASSQFPLPVFVGTVVLLGYGNLGAQVARGLTDEEAPLARASAFVALGSVAGVAGVLAARAVAGDPVATDVSGVVGVVLAGALLGATLRSVLFERDDPLVMLSVGLLAWLLAAIVPALSPTTLAGAVVVTVFLGYVSYALETASVTGALTGVLLTFLTAVLGGFAWLAVLVTFFGVGGLSAKFRYEEKLDRGVAEDNEGARGSGNVLGNAAVAIGAVVAYAATTAGMVGGVAPTVFLYAFAGSLAAAMSDTLSSEIGGIYDTPRLITTLEPVDPGTDGAITWQGELAGVVGAATIAGVAGLTLVPVDALGLGVVTVAGVVGMTVDSLLGATVEGDLVGNQGVNFLATLAGGVAGAAIALALAL